jgi:hypothetical protein
LILNVALTFNADIPFELCHFIDKALTNSDETIPTAVLYSWIVLLWQQRETGGS